MNKKITVMFAILLLSFITGLANAQGAPSGQEQSLGFDPFADEVVENSQNNSSTDLDPFAELELDPFSDGELDLTEQTPEPEKLSAKEQIEVLMSKFEKGEYSKKGADDCMRCHKKTEGVADVFHTPHGNSEISNSPMAGLQCEACHGPQGKHSGTDEPMLSFSSDSALTADMKNSVCIDCHQDGHRQNWVGSVHNLEETACVDCHTVHVKKDPVVTTQGQSEVCYGCHIDKRADSHKRSSHPIASQQLTCTDCHSTHGSFGPSSIKQISINENCYQCHAEKRGPKLWEHAPVAENCANCHTAHGSVNDSLLKARPPMLCKECHSESGHPSTVPGTNSSIQVAGQSCMNCHTQVHGSNHPNGYSLRQ